GNPKGGLGGGTASRGWEAGRLAEPGAQQEGAGRQSQHRQRARPYHPAVDLRPRRRGHRVNRRGLLLLPAAAAIAWNPALAEAETPRVGFVQLGSRQGNQSLLQAFRETLSALGWTDGSNIAIVERSAGERTEQLPGTIEKLIASGVAVLVTVGSPATLAAARANAAVPIVLVGVDDPVGLGVVESLAQPGGNLTGFSLSSTELIATRVQLLQELVPGIRRLAVIVRGDPGLEQKLQDIRRNAAEIGIEPLMLEATTGTALRLAFSRLRAERSGALYVASGPLGPVKRA